MTLSDIQALFNRAMIHTFNVRKILFTFLMLALCGLLAVFFRALATQAGMWVKLSLTFMPIFLCAGVLLALGVILVRIYHDELKNQSASIGEVIAKSWDVIMGATYFAIPIILSYLILWMLLGIFFLLRQIPAIGDFFGTVLIFAPFLINLGSILLCIMSLAMLFFLTPVLALGGFNRLRISQTLTKRLKTDPFSNCLLWILSLIPLVFILGLLLLSAVMTDTICYSCEDPLHRVMQWFFLMLPFTALLSPTVVFFFNFSAESHVWMKKKMREGEQQRI